MRFGAESVSAWMCVLCGREIAPADGPATCAVCGPHGTLDVRIDYEAIERAGFRLPTTGWADHWFFAPLLPIPNVEPPALRVGATPLLPVDALARRLNIAGLWIKDESHNPSGSLKDRASSIAVAIARASGIDAAACASTGNAASSLSMFAANTGLRSYAFVPVTTSVDKITRLRRLGAIVFLADSYERAFELCEEAVAEFGWFDRNAALDPRLVEGKKTCGIEIGLQTAARPPDWVSVSVGDGCTIAGIWKGLKEAVRFGPALASPRLLATQARRVAPLARAFAEGRNEWDVKPSSSVADSIAVADPRNGAKALSAVRESGGVFVDVDDDEIIAAREELQAHGFVADPAAVAGIAGIRRAREEGTIRDSDRIVHVLTAGRPKSGGPSAAAPPSPRYVTCLEDMSRAALGADKRRTA